MAYYSEGGYCAEEMSRPYVAGGGSGYCHGEQGGERYAVRREYEEVDEVARAGRGHHHDVHGHVGHVCHEGCHEHLGGGHREHVDGHGHGHDYGGHGHGGRGYDACESKYYA